MHAIFSHSQQKKRRVFNPHKNPLKRLRKKVKTVVVQVFHISHIVFLYINTQRFSLFHAFPSRTWWNFKFGLLLSWWNARTYFWWKIHYVHVLFYLQVSLRLLFSVVLILFCTQLFRWVFNSKISKLTLNCLYITSTCGNDRVVTDARERLTNFYTKCSSPSFPSSTHLNEPITIENQRTF